MLNGCSRLVLPCYRTTTTTTTTINYKHSHIVTIDHLMGMRVCVCVCDDRSTFVSRIVESLQVDRIKND